MFILLAALTVAKEDEGKLDIFLETIPMTQEECDKRIADDFDFEIGDDTILGTVISLDVECIPAPETLVTGL